MPMNGLAVAQLVLEGRANMAGAISARADKFAQKLRPTAPVDNRTQDELMAAFQKKYEPHRAMRDARRRAKKAGGVK